MNVMMIAESNFENDNYYKYSLALEKCIIMQNTK